MLTADIECRGTKKHQFLGKATITSRWIEKKERKSHPSPHINYLKLVLQGMKVRMV